MGSTDHFFYLLSGLHGIRGLARSGIIDDNPQPPRSSPGPPPTLSRASFRGGRDVRATRRGSPSATSAAAPEPPPRLGAILLRLPEEVAASEYSTPQRSGGGGNHRHHHQRIHSGASADDASAEEGVSLHEFTERLLVRRIITPVYSAAPASASASNDDDDDGSAPRPQGGFRDRPP